MWVSVNFGKFLVRSVMDSPTLQDFPHRPIDWPGPSFLRPTHTENLCLFFLGPHTHNTQPTLPTESRFVDDDYVRRNATLKFSIFGIFRSIPLYSVVFLRN